MQTGAAYIRVSTEEQLEFSPDSQIKKIKEYAAVHKIVLPETYIFIDEGISGRSAKKRPAFMEMIGTAKSRPKPFDVILLWKFSRFARNRQDSILYKSMLRKECGVDVISITEQLSDDPTAILIEALLEAMDEYYSINLAQEVRRGMNEKFTRGGVVSIPPFGYKMGKKCFEIEDSEASAVTMMFEAFLSGKPYRQIAGELNRMGLRSKRGNLFEDRTVEYILSNPVYTGRLRRSLNGMEVSDRFKNGAEITVVQGEHRPLVTDEMFHAVQDRREEIKRSGRNYRKISGGDFMLQGLVRCSNCGSTLTRSGKGDTLQCCKYARGSCAKSHSITIKKLNEAVLKQLAQDLGSTEFFIRRGKRKSAEKKENLLRLLGREQQRLERMQRAYESGVDTLEEYADKKQNCIDNIAALRMEITAIDVPDEGLLDTLKMIPQQVVLMLSSLDFAESSKNSLLRSILSQVIFCRKNDTILICYRDTEE